MNGKGRRVPTHRHNGMLALRLALIAAAVLLVYLGAANGEAMQVFRKAANICLECIGIG